MYHYADANGSVGLPAVEVHRNIYVNVHSDEPATRILSPYYVVLLESRLLSLLFVEFIPWLLCTVLQKCIIQPDCKHVGDGTSPTS